MWFWWVEYNADLNKDCGCLSFAAILNFAVSWCEV